MAGPSQQALADRDDPARTARPEPLVGRVIRVIFLWYVLVAVALTGVQLAFEYRSAQRRLLADVAAMQRTFSPGLEDALWRFNLDVTRGILSGIREIPAVVAVEVRDEAGRRIASAGRTGDDDHPPRAGGEGGLDRLARALGAPVSRTFPLVHVDEAGRRHPVGAWTVHSDTALAVEQVRNTLVVILVNSAIKSLMLWLIFVVVVRRMVGRPLSQVRAFLEDLDGDGLGQRPFVLATRGRHEFHALTDALNGMVAKLRRSFEDNETLMRDLRQMNATLQARVAERTRELEVLATTDRLTGLSNRRGLDEAVAAEALRARRPGGGFALILADVDHFKAINDLHGHRAGDEVLAALSAALRAGIRADDVLGRWGGEEFMVVCPDTGLAAAAALAEDLRRRVEATRLPGVGRRTCSFGVAALTPGESVESLVARADAALYRCKRQGRNRVEAGLADGTGTRPLRGAA
ncbi:GGDEF domain-containing protein [uncultured Methylobacterium sp.]|jgi:diguanylate cyclase (GGDEF)-like protein|uniref:GGDEF domain-containing protein n=1 Tax=uncultured Methylobacterium sp. TaxID=157278 RepID=UPI002613789D|nr:GGDEF domain-containing protein [uncultured Methylobacterium sp.]